MIKTDVIVNMLIPGYIIPALFSVITSPGTQFYVSPGSNPWSLPRYSRVVGVDADSHVRLD